MLFILELMNTNLEIAPRDSYKEDSEMRVQIIEKFGPAGVFKPADLPEPTPGPGQVAVRQEASSVNPVDYKIRQGEAAGIAPALPAVLGTDISGTVIAVGDGVTDLKMGDAVYGAAAGVAGQGGAYAEVVVAQARLLAKRPRSLTAREAAALPLVGITALEGLKRAGVAAGTTVLVRGGTGGVGHIVVQYAKSKGAHVVATAGSDQKAKIVRELGADEVVNYRDKSTEGKGFDIVFNATGGPELETDFQAARLNGQVVAIVSLFKADLSTLHAKGLSLHLVFMLLPMLAGIGGDDHKRILEELAELVDAGKIRPLIDPNRFTLDKLGAAHAHAESGAAVGKVVVDIANGA
jgi:NADPH2:quinone reductase